MIQEPIGKWFVWTRTGRRPRYSHGSYENAATEAKRLAADNPGTKFIVLHMTDKFHVPTTSEPELLTEPAIGDPLLETADGTEV